MTADISKFLDNYCILCFFFVCPCLIITSSSENLNSMCYFFKIIRWFIVIVQRELNTIEVIDRPIGNNDTVSALEESLRDIGIKGAAAFSTKFFTLDKPLIPGDLKKIAGLVHHPVTQDALLNKPLDNDQGWDFAIKVDFKPGVTDNAARVLKKDIGLTGFDPFDVYTSDVHYIKGEYNEELKEMLERLSSNPQIHDITILTKDKFQEQNGFETKIHPVKLEERPNFFDVDIGAMNEKELIKMSKKGTLNPNLVKPGMTEKEIGQLRGGTLSLYNGNYGLDYLDAIIDYSRSGLNTQVKGRKKGVLTDTEIELIAQMWSEHCRHSLYNAIIPGLKEGIFKTFIKNPTSEVLKKKPHLGVSIYKDNSGVFQFNEKWNILLKNETHNSPSALDPYGGAITGIVGVIRDPAGTGIGGEVIGNFLFYFLGHPEDRKKYYKIKTPCAGDMTATAAAKFTLEELLLNPKQIFDGVVKGVQDGANQMGISLNLGICQYHNNYNGKPIVGVGSWARQPRFINGKPAHEKHIDIGDRLYIIGGRAGRDGIHGATFSSEGLTANSPATAVQIGDAYTQRKTLEALLELRDKGYIKYVTDLGAGGVSCAALEMAEEIGGLDIDLDQLLIKYHGMTATELFLNESQERMAIAVDEKNQDNIEAILKEHEVEFSDIGVFTDSGRAIVKANGEEVVNMNMDFIHNGFPQRKLTPSGYRLSGDDTSVLEELFEKQVKEKHNKAGSLKDYIRREFYDMLARPNLGPVHHFTDKMDSTVKGLSVQHCVQGKGRISTKTACTLVDLESNEALIQSYGHSERQSYIDSECMGKNAFLRSIGNTLSMGGRLDHMVATDQALWQSSDKPEYQQMLIEANKGMADVITGCELPVISGKDSMYNQATIYDKDGNVVKRGVYPTLLMTTMAKIDNAADIITIDAKKQGDLVYVVGSKTKGDIGGSEFVNMYAEECGRELAVGKVSDENIAEVYDTFKRIDKANKENILQSSNYIENGGLMTAINQTAMAGELGIEFDINKLDKDCMFMEAMYGETEGRFLVTISPENKDKFEKMFEGKYSRIGEVKGDKVIMKYDEGTLLSESVEDMLTVHHKRNNLRRAI